MRGGPMLTRRQGLVLGTAAAGVALARPAWSQAERLRMTIVTGGTGGVFYPYGGGLARILSDRGDNIQATAQVTGGSVDNCKLVHAGDAEIGFATVDSAYDAIEGVAAYAEDGPQDVRTLMVLYDSFFHVIGSESAGVASIADLRGKRVSVGSAGSSTETIGDRVLEAAGLDPQTDVIRDNLSVAESAAALQDGKIAAFFWIGGVPTAAVRDLGTTGQVPLVFIPTSAELAAMEAQYPGQYRPFLLAANTYPGQATDVQGLGVANILVVNTNTEDETITRILTTIFDNLGEVHQIHAEARKLELQTAAIQTAVPFHQAAEAFYREKGVL